MSNFITKKHLLNKFLVETSLYQKYGVSSSSLNSKTREQRVARARFLAFFLLRTEFKMSLSLIAQLYGKDHTTVINGIQRVKELDLEKEASEVLLSTYAPSHHHDQS